MDSLITAAARALAAGDPLSALTRVALRDDPSALALRGTAMAQLGDLPRARTLLARAARGFGAREAHARARCRLAEAEVALVSRDLGHAVEGLSAARAMLTRHGDRTNAAHAGYLQARALLLVGRLDNAEQVIATLDADALPLPSRAGCWLVAAGIAMRRIDTATAHAAIDRARAAARSAAIPALAAEVERAGRALEVPAARLVSERASRPLSLADVEALIGSGALVIDACRNAVRRHPAVVALAGRPVLFALARALGEAWPRDVSRGELIARAFRGREADESHRARLRVEIGRLRKAMSGLAAIEATRDGFVLVPTRGAQVAVLAPPAEDAHAELLALLADGEAWSSSALAMALGTSPRTVQRALEVLAEAGKVERFGRGRACRWVAPTTPGFPTSLLLPGPIASG